LAHVVEKKAPLIAPRKTDRQTSDLNEESEEPTKASVKSRVGAFFFKKNHNDKQRKDEDKYEGNFTIYLSCCIRWEP
jgi:hypothetical protein